MKSLKLYRVVRYLFRPSIIAVFAYSKEDAKDIVTKKYGPDTCVAYWMKIKRGLCIEEVSRR